MLVPFTTAVIYCCSTSNSPISPFLLLPFLCPAIKLHLIPFTEAVFCIKGTLCSSSRWLHPSPQIFPLQWFTSLSKQFAAHLSAQSQLILICFVAAQLMRSFHFFSFTFKASCTPLALCWWSMKLSLSQEGVERRFSHLPVIFLVWFPGCNSYWGGGVCKVCRILCEISDIRLNVINFQWAQEIPLENLQQVESWIMNSWLTCFKWVLLFFCLD